MCRTRLLDSNTGFTGVQSSIFRLRPAKPQLKFDSEHLFATPRKMIKTKMGTETDKLEFKRLDPNAVLPTRGSVASAGLDLYTIEDVSIPPRQRVLARTGLAVAIPAGFYGRVAPRSGLAMKSGLDVLSGVIDADYRGEIGCLLYNTGDAPIELSKHTKMCQLIIEKIITPEAAWSDDLNATARGAGGFGSTG
jgi:dUTP pyrophosphatase